MTKTNSLVRLSKTMSVALRHDPASFGIELDSEGWVDTDCLVAALRKIPRWKEIAEADFHQVIAASEKKRFEIASGRIRALYGHSIQKKIVKEAVTPPPVLYHGTARRNLDPIAHQGLLPMSRQYVHLSEDIETAVRVGKRKAQDIVLLKVNTTIRPELKFYYGNDQTWLADEVPPEIIEVIPQG